MKKLTLLFLFFGLVVSAQNNRVTYEYTFRSDSTKMDSLKTEWMYLDINKNGSKYYSKKAFESDSIMNESLKKQMAAGMRNISVSKFNAGDISFEVEKTYPEYKTFLVSDLSGETFKILEDRKLNWKILSDKKQLGEFNVQKATTDFAGRNWEAWFTTDVPIQDGPYKFSGLPGLIVEIVDQTGSHKMELKGIKTLTEVQQDGLNTDGKDIPFAKKKPIEINRKQYVKQLIQYENDPVQGMREMLSRPNTTVTINQNGKNMSDPKQILRELEKSAREKMQKNNNKIELIP